MKLLDRPRHIRWRHGFNEGDFPCSDIELCQAWSNWTGGEIVASDQYGREVFRTKPDAGSKLGA